MNEWMNSELYKELLDQKFWTSSGPEVLVLQSAYRGCAKNGWPNWRAQAKKVWGDQKSLRLFMYNIPEEEGETAMNRLEALQVLNRSYCCRWDCTERVLEQIWKTFPFPIAAERIEKRVADHTQVDQYNWCSTHRHTDLMWGTLSEHTGLRHWLT